MKRVLLTATPALATQLVSALAHASAPVGTAVTTVTVATAPTPEPTPAAPPVAAPNASAMEPALPVPVMDDLLLIVVGLMLMAVAFRSLRNSKGAQKLLSIAALGGSLTLVGMGADRTIAIGIMDNPIAPTCEGGDITVSDATTANSVTNNCESDQENGGDHERNHERQVVGRRRWLQRRRPRAVWKCWNLPPVGLRSNNMA